MPSKRKRDRPRQAPVHKPGKRARERRRLQRMAREVKETFPDMDLKGRRYWVLQRISEDLVKDKRLDEGARHFISIFIYGDHGIRGISQEQALERLGELKEKRALPVLMMAFENPHASAKIQLLAIKALADLGDRRAEPVLTKALRHWNVGYVAEAARGLAAMRAKKSAPLMIEAFQRMRVHNTRHALAKALAEFKDARAVDVIYEHLFTARRFEGEQSADIPIMVDALRGLKPSKVEPLVLSLAHHQSHAVRLTAGYLLGTMAFDLAKDRPGLEKRLQVAKKALSGLPENKKGVLLYAIAKDKRMQGQIPVDWEKAERSKKDYLSNLRHQAAEVSFQEMLEIFGLVKKEK